MKKTDIETHSESYRPCHPAVNVKSYRFPSESEAQARFKCCRKTAAKALSYAFDSHREMFWEEAQELADKYLGNGYKVYSEGRSGGWLVVHGLPDIDSWDALRVSRWGNFSRAILRAVNWACSAENVFETIQVNDWAPSDALLDDEEAESEERADWEARDTVTV